VGSEGKRRALEDHLLGEEEGSIFLLFWVIDKSKEERDRGGGKKNFRGASTWSESETEEKGDTYYCP